MRRSVYLSRLPVIPSSYHPAICFWALVALALIMQLYALPVRSQVKASTFNSVSSVPLLPYIQAKSPGNGGFTYRLSLYYSNPSQQQTAFEIVPGGCVKSIKVNNQNIPFHSDKLCDARPGMYWNPYSAPLYIDLAPYLIEGRNSIEIATPKSEFDIGPVILYGNHLSTWIGLTMILIICILLIHIMQRYTGDRISGFLVAGGFLVHMNRFSKTGIPQYAMDLPGHLAYMTSIADTWQWPKPFMGWSMYHPPLYYTVGALLIHIANWFRSVDVLTCLQFFSLCCFMAFLIFAALSLQRLIRNKLAWYAALLLLIFYPSGILFSARLDSHLLFYACYSGCLYFTLCWLQDISSPFPLAGEGRGGGNYQPIPMRRDSPPPQGGREYKNLGLALTLLGLALATRANALILFPLLALAGFAYWRKYGWPQGALHHSYVRTGLLFVFLGLMVSAGRTEYYRVEESRQEPFLVGNTKSLPRALMLNDQLSNVLIPNIPGYLESPLWDVWNDSSERQYFWNSMIKSSFTGEFDWSDKGLADAMGKLFLAMILYLCDAWWLHRRFLRSHPEWTLCLASLFIPIAALMEHRWINPYACSEDFRYIYPAIASFCGLYGIAIERHINEWRPFRAWLGIGLGVAFTLCSIGFYLL